MAVSQDVREDGPGNVYVNLNDGFGNPINSVSGSIDVNVTAFSSGTIPNAALTQVPQNGSSVSLLAIDATRKGFVIENNSTAICFLAFAATATTAAGGYTRRLQPNSAYESPTWIYTGAISAIWAATGSGFAEITSCT